MRRTRARFEFRGQAIVQRGDRNEYTRKIGLCHGRKQIQIAFDQRVLGDDRERMPALGQHFDHLPRDAITPFDRLVRVGVGAQIDRTDAVTGFGQFRAQKFRRIGLGK